MAKNTPVSSATWGWTTSRSLDTWGSRLRASRSRSPAALRAATSSRA
ncbi:MULTISPECIES: hypothetical protein [Streptomyces violaceusniger group]|nr:MULTISPECIES: hypothetical protein [Streptomyces violaceusniger group]